MFRRKISANRAIAGGIVLIGIILAFTFNAFNAPIFFAALAFASLIGSMNRYRPRTIYGGIQGFIWLLVLAFLFGTAQWSLFFWIGIIALFCTVIQLSIRRWGTKKSKRASPPQYSQPQYYYQSLSPLPAYQQGYQPSVFMTGTYEGNGQDYQYSSPSQQYEQPQAHYPQAMPPPSQ